jgi:hypothetical protein
MRAEILTRIQGLLAQEDLEAIRTDVRSAIEDFRALTRDEIRKQREAWAEAHPDQSVPFVYEPAPEEAEFDLAFQAFKEREKAWRQNIADIQRQNLEQKLAMLDRLRKTIQEEENIGAAFAVFNEVREQWDQVGEIPGDRHKEVHDQYYRLRDDFFYNIKIYKELKDNDLRINLKSKEVLLEEAKGLADIEDIFEREKAARALQKRWMDIGPSPRETYKELSDTFFGMIRPVFDEVKAHYDAIRETFKVHAEQKQALLENLRALVAEEVEASHEGWQAATQKMLDLQNQWKGLGFAGKELNETLWANFRELADVFFKRKQLFYDQIKAQGSANKAAKEALIAEAEALSGSTDWRKTTEAMLELQKKWKEAGPTPAAEEQKLWRRFRKAQDTFFKAKKAQFADREESEKANLAEKEALLHDIEHYTLTGDRKEDLEVLKQFSTRWNNVGHVPRKNLDDLMTRFRKAMDEKYNALSAQRSERTMESYRQRVDHLADGDSNQLRREQTLLREKLDRLKQRITMTEENIERFTGKGAEAIREQYEKSIRADKREMQEIIDKLKLLRKAAE